MKKTLANIRTLAALLIASATIAACSNDYGIVDNAQPTQQQAPQVYTLTLQAGKADNAQTRALALDGEKLMASWADGDQLTVTMADGTEVGTLTAPTASGQTATFSGTLTVPSGKTISGGDKLTLTYHPVASADYSSQTGTLESAAACDMATAEVTVTAVGDDNKITITETSVNFTTQTAVLKITMQDAGGNKINATELLVSAAIGSNATNIFSFSPTDATYTANGDGILYFALPNAASLQAMLTAENPDFATFLNTATVSFTVTKDYESYTVKTEKKYTFATGKYYATTLTKPAPAYTLLSAATTSDCGKVVCADGHLHDAETAVPSGCTAVGILGKVTATGHGLILALNDATSQTWNTINGWTSETTYASTTLKLLPDGARGSLTGYTTLGETTVSNWAVAQKIDYEAIFTNLGSATYDSDGTTYDNNVNAYITTGVGGTAISGDYWSATERDGSIAWGFGSKWWDKFSKLSSYSVRPVLAF